MKLKSKDIIFFSIVILIGIFLLVLPEVAMARPGGGHSYSGGGSSGGGGGGDLIGIIIYLIIYLLPPYISIPLIIILIIGYNIYQKKNKNSGNQIVSKPTYAVQAQSVANIAQQTHGLKNVDANFSRILFLDFVSSVFIKFQAYKYSPKDLKTIHPFFDQSIINTFASKPSDLRINEIVVGGINILQILQTGSAIQITVEINANYTQTTGGKSTRYIVTEKWLLERKAGVLSPTPDKMHKLSCPACGAPANFNDAGNCAHCGTLITPGNMQWFVRNRAIVYSDTIKTNSLTSYAPEVGTNYPTVYSPTVQSENHQFAARHNTDWDSYWSVFYHNIAAKYFTDIYDNWSMLTWNNVRHLLTDRLWESYNFWIDEYKRHGYRNVLEDTQILKMHLAKIETDKFYEAITVRIFASTKDYVVNKEGKVIGGTNKAARVFSEYWTFIRRSGVENDQYDMKSCPNCGAPLDKMGQNGVCEYCGAKVSTGEFSWVLAVITQDEEYKG
ncbi:MAG: TIM44-like domain-containing protein [Bacteroidales bacterium]|nr:TIM44-like domain-containing protein [Bacteroidales bacterium]